jgi:hypothetical protein
MHAMERMDMVLERALETMTRRIMLGALALAIVHQFLFYGQPLGISYPIFVASFYVYFFSFTKGRFTKLWTFSTFLLLAILLLSMTYVWFDNPIFTIVNAIAIPCLIVLHTTVFASQREIRWFERRMIWQTLDQLLPQSFKHIPVPFRLLSKKLGKNVDADTKRTVNRVIIGLLLSVPLLFIVISLLMSADQLFGELLENVPNFFAELSLSQWIFRLIWMIALFVYLFGYVSGLIMPTRYEWEKNGESQSQAKLIALDPIIAITVLIAVTLVYVLFVAVQFSYLFSAWDGELPSGTTYAEYARRGFFELLAVSIINFLLLISTLPLFREGKSGLKRISKVVLSVLIGCTTVMLVSAFIRLQLYEQMYGYTYIRFLVHGFMIYMTILILVAGIRIWRSSFSLARYYIIISVVALVGINYIGMDRLIAQWNIERYRQQDILDSDYLSELSSDAVPRLVKFAEAEPYYLESIRVRYEVMQAEEDSRDWRSYNWSRARAMKVMGELLEEVSHNR